MKLFARWTLAAGAVVLGTWAGAPTVIAAPAVGQVAQAPAAGENPAVHPAPGELLTLEEAKARYKGPLSQVVLEFLSRMDTAVNKDKASVTAADWEPLGQLLDRDRFHRVGNFAEHMGWKEYQRLLVDWANSSWWKGYFWRMSEVPASAGRPGLVYLETEERSSRSGPVTEQGPYDKLESIAVYELDDNKKIVGLHVYDHQPR